ncbi:hypothetical protein GCM10023238_28830 [Streptomyces heliomycini]
MTSPNFTERVNDDGTRAHGRPFTTRTRTRTRVRVLREEKPRDQHPRDRPQPAVQIRLVVIQVLVISLLGTLGGRLWYLQIREGDQYAKEAPPATTSSRSSSPRSAAPSWTPAEYPLADNETRLVVSASRTDLLKMKDDGRAVLTKLAGVLGMDAEEVLRKVRLCDAENPPACWNGSPYQPIPITDEATAKQALQIRERAEDFPGITAEPQALRRYRARQGQHRPGPRLPLARHRRGDHQGPGHQLALPALRHGRPTPAWNASTTSRLRRTGPRHAYTYEVDETIGAAIS